MKKYLLFLCFIFYPLLGITSGYYHNDYYMVNKPGHVIPQNQFKRSLRPVSEYVQQDIYDSQIEKQRYFQAIKNRELEGRIPYQESRKTATSTTYSY